MVKFNINNTVINTENIEKLKDKMPELKDAVKNALGAENRIEEECKALKEKNAVYKIGNTQAEDLAGWCFKDNLDDGELATIPQELDLKFNFLLYNLERGQLNSKKPLYVPVDIQIDDTASETFKNTYNNYLDKVVAEVRKVRGLDKTINAEQKEETEKEATTFIKLMELQKAGIADVYYTNSYPRQLKNLDQLKMLNRAAVDINLIEPDSRPLSEMYGIKTLDEQSLRQIIARVAVMKWSYTNDDREWRLKELKKMSENFHAKMEGKTYKEKTTENTLDLDKMSERIESVQKQLDALKKASSGTLEKGNDKPVMSKFLNDTQVKPKQTVNSETPKETTKVNANNKASEKHTKGKSRAK